MSFRAAAASLAALAFAGCAIFGNRAADLREDIVETALDQVGEDYEFGGADPDDGFDCSGLVHYAYGESGIEVPRSTAELRRAGVPVKFASAEPADLLFYRFGQGPSTRLHVVLYLGEGRAVHAPVSDGEVEEIDVTAPAWKKRYVGAVRLLKRG